MKLRVDLHSHTNLDPVDGVYGLNVVKYDYIEALDAAVKAKISVLSLTHHKKLIFTKKMQLNAKKRGILLFPGFEAVIEGCDVVLINPTTDKITTFSQLRKEKSKNDLLFVLAPHPFYFGGRSLGLKLIKNIELFDGIEYCHFHTWWFNIPNWLAMLVARFYDKSAIGTSDAHNLDGFGLTYSEVNLSRIDKNTIISNLKKSKNVSYRTKCINITYFLRVFRGYVNYKKRRSSDK